MLDPVAIYTCTQSNFLKNKAILSRCTVYIFKGSKDTPVLFKSKYNSMGICSSSRNELETKID